MITVLLRGGSSQMITVLHRGGPPNDYDNTYYILYYDRRGLANDYGKP